MTQPIEEIQGSGGKSYSQMNMAEKIAHLKEMQEAAQQNYLNIHNKNAAKDAQGIQQDAQILRRNQPTELRPAESVEIATAGMTNRELPFKNQLSFDSMFSDQAATSAAQGAAGRTMAPAATGLASVAGSTAAQAIQPRPEEPQAVEDRQQTQSQRQSATAAETVVTTQTTTTVNREEAVDDQVQSVQGGVAQTVTQNDGDDRVSIKEQDRTFEAKSAYTSNFGDNAGAKGAVTAAGQADGGYSGGDEQSNQGQQRQQ